MRTLPVYLIFLLFGLQSMGVGIAWSQSPAQKCRVQLFPLVNTKNITIEEVDLWARFERDALLRPDSSKAMQLDSKVQQLVWLLDYLCETIDGVPLNELAVYLTENLEEKSKQEFKTELIVLGKSTAEIDIWFTFSDLSLKNENRKLEVGIIYNSIQKALPLLLKYKTLAEEVERSPNKKHIERVNHLCQEIDQLESSDSYLALALWETSQVPHWDIDESAGGS
jgi:hypothetical protein